MSIQIQDLVSELRTEIDEKNADFWESGDILNALNRSIRRTFEFCYRVTEFIFLEPADITIDSSAVSNETKTFDLPTNTIYLSSYTRDRKYWGDDGEIDLRPNFVPDSDTDDDNYQELGVHYYVQGDKIYFFTAFTETGTVKVNVKKYPARITSESGTLTFPYILFNPIVSGAVYFAKRKDDNATNQDKIEFEQALRDAYDTLRGMQGHPRVIAPSFDWADSGDL